MCVYGKVAIMREVYYCSSKFEIKTPVFSGVTSNLKFSLPYSFVTILLHTTPSSTEATKMGNILVYYLMAADYPLVSLLS